MKENNHLPQSDKAQQPEHCDLEDGYCKRFVQLVDNDGNLLGCPWGDCPHDTRSHKHTPAPELTKMLLRSCFGDYEDCPCDDECIVSEYCSKYHEDHEKNSCGMTSSQCGMVQEYEKAEAARAATLAAYDEIVLWASQYRDKKFTVGMLGEHIASLRQQQEREQG